MRALIRRLLQVIRLEALLAIPYRLIYSLVLRQYGRGAYVSPFIQAVGLDCVSLGDGSRISRNTRLLALKSYGKQTFTPSISIGNNVSIGFGCTLSCVNQLEIGDDVTIGDNVYLADSQHDYAHPEISVLDQPLLPGSIKIGRGAWVGYGAFVAGDVCIGAFSVVGANSVVTKSVEPYTVVAGVPAKPIKRFDHGLGQWVRLTVESSNS